MQDHEHLAYPIGRFQRLTHYDVAHLKDDIAVIERFPTALKEVLSTVQPEQWHWNYRPGGWNVVQLVHHCADSHMNAFIRFKLALTEDVPTIKPYEEAKWAEHNDEHSTNLTPSLMIIEGVHHRWTTLMSGMSEDQWLRTYYHPESKRNVPLSEAAHTYAWHCRHHLAHIQGAVQSEGNFINR